MKTEEVLEWFFEREIEIHMNLTEKVIVSLLEAAKRDKSKAVHIPRAVITEDGRLRMDITPNLVMYARTKGRLMSIMYYYSINALVEMGKPSDYDLDIDYVSQRLLSRTLSSRKSPESRWLARRTQRLYKQGKRLLQEYESLIS
jgi:hypothetical protein